MEPHKSVHNYPDDPYFSFSEKSYSSCTFRKLRWNLLFIARRAGSDGSMSASGSAGPGFDPRRDSKFSFENFQHRG